MKRLLFAALVAIVAATVAACSGEPPAAPPATCSAVPLSHASVRRHAAPVPSGLSLIVVSDGSPDSLLLEWMGGPANATRWQYRLRRGEKKQPYAYEGARPTPQLLAWEAWTDIPNSGAATRSCRLTGLGADTLYEFEVRAVAGRSRGKPSVNGIQFARLAGHPARGATHGRRALPRVFPDHVVEGDGRTLWRLGNWNRAITIPDGVRLVGGGAYDSRALPCATPTPAPGVEPPPILSDCDLSTRTWLHDLATLSSVTFSYVGLEKGRRMDGPASSARRVHELFDRLMDSLRVAPTGASRDARGHTLVVGPFAGARELIVVSDGSHDSLLLEWGSGPAYATKWQYRSRRRVNSEPLAWEAWTDIPNSGTTERRGATRSYEVTGLRADTGYDFEVRPVVGTTAGEASPVSQGGSTQPTGQLPGLSPDQIVEGDGRTKWRIAYFTIVIPDGVRLAGGGAFESAPCHEPTAVPGAQPTPTPVPGCPGGGGTSLIDVATGSQLTLSDDGVEWNRTIVEPAFGSAEQRANSVQRVNDLFDQIVGSIQKAP